MEILKAKLMSLSVYKNMLETPQVASLLELCEAKTPDALLRAYTDFVYSVWREGFDTLSESVYHHLCYDDSFIGDAIAKNRASEALQNAAAMDIRRLSAISVLSCSALKRNIYNFCVSKNQDYGPIVQNLAELRPGKGFTEEAVFSHYRTHGCGIFSQSMAFVWEKGKLMPVQNPDRICQDEMYGYHQQRNAVLENTRILVSGRPANNVLLYGDSGTGKSAMVKSLINSPEFYNLRLIEIQKNSLDELGTLSRYLDGRPQRFIIYIDDLSFEKEDKAFSALKTALEGGLERRPDNVAIYATSNRRHLIRESFEDRAGTDVHARETLEERTSLSERFGLRIAYLALNKADYTSMVIEMCHRRALPFDEATIRTRANQWEIRHGGRTPRAAVQLVDQLTGEAELMGTGKNS